MAYILDRLGRKIDLDDLAFINKLVDLKRTSGSKPWPVIEEIIQFWEKKNPKKWKAFLVDLQDTRETRLDPKFALSKGKTLRYTLDLPQDIMTMIRCIYSTEELPLNGKNGQRFFLEFAKRFPKMKVAEKL